MMKSIYLSIMILLYSLTSNAQTRSISGIIKDAETGRPVAQGTLRLLNAKAGTAAHADGSFNLVIPVTSIHPVIKISSVGYETDTLHLQAGRNFYEVLLRPTKANLNEVVVTGVSRATQVRENPIPIVGVSTKKLEQNSQSNIVDVLVKNVPGLTAVKTGPNISKPFIRGLGYNRVLTLYDGIRQEGQQWGDEHGLEVDAYNISKAEVVKGPASLIYGSDALAGVVGLIPAMPAAHDYKWHGKFFTEYQTNNQLIGNGLRLTYGTAHWLYAIRGSYRIAKNYINPVDGRVYNTGFRETNASATVRHNTDKGYSSLNFTLYDNWQGIPDGSRDSLSRRFTYQVNEGDADDIKARPVVPEAALNSYTLSPLVQHIQHYRLYTKNHYQLGRGDVDALLAFQQNVRREYNHPTQPEQAGMYVRLNTINYGFNYNAPVIANTELSFGVNGMYQNNKSLNATDFPIPDYQSFDAGFYAFAKWRYERFTISGGLRYDARYLKGDDFYTDTDPLTGFSRRAGGSVLGNSYLQFPAFSQTFNGLSLSLGAAYQLNEQVTIKGNIARGYRAPSITEYASNGLDPGAHIIYLGNRNFKPEFSLQQDLGIDVSAQNLSFTFSLFNNNLSNFIYLAQLVDGAGNSITDAQGNKTYQYQQAKAQLYGLETTVSLHPQGWRGFAFDNALSLTYGFNRSSTYRNAGLQGEYLPLIPPAHLLSSLSQEIKLNSSLIKSVNVKGEADINAVQNRYLALNTTESYTPGYTLFDIGMGAEVQYSKRCALQVQFQINNLFNTAYQSHLNRLKYFEYYAASFTGRTGIYNMGRNICLKLIMPF